MHLKVHRPINSRSASCQQRSADERSDIRGQIGEVPRVAALTRATFSVVELIMRLTINEAHQLAVRIMSAA
jgi:hypothetical protein